MVNLLIEYSGKPVTPFGGASLSRVGGVGKAIQADRCRVAACDGWLCFLLEAP